MVESLLASPVQPKYDAGTTGAAAPLPALPRLNGHVPVIGDGVLQQVVVIRHVRGNTVAVDAVGPWAGQIVHYLTRSEVKTVGTASVAVARYGAIPRHQIALTFDDGPGKWTPSILNVLAHYHIPATFFLIGKNIAQYPQYVQREVREGHLIGNHSVTHPNLATVSDFWIRLQILLTDHIIRAATNRATLFFRNPYDGNDPASINASIRVIYQAQRAGYIVTAYNVDTNDWQFITRHRKPTPLSKLLPRIYPHTDKGAVILLHDGGGDRSLTVAYLKKAIPWALAHGYVFTTVRWAVSAQTHPYSTITPSLTDRLTYWAARGIFDWLSYVLLVLFLFGVAGMFGLNAMYIILASGQEWLARRRVSQVPTLDCLVSVAIAAYNEEAVISKTVESLLRSTHWNLEIIVVNDGSTDRTLQVLEALAAKHRRLKVITKENGGKATALNRAFAEASGEFVVTGDADTIFAPEAIAFLVHHLTQNRKVGAVAGLVRVGNIRGLLTAWQALEYIKSIAVTRTAEHVLRTITVVPGACSAWRRKAVLDVGGLDFRTLAEDCELTIQLQRAGWKIEQDNRAVAYTEAPEGARKLYKQRIRWTYGNVQVFWMHKNMLFRPRYGLLGMFTIPYAMLSVVMPILFLPVLYAVMVSMVTSGNGATLIPYAVAFTAAEVVVSAVGLLITRSSPWLILMAPLFRVINEPLRAVLLYNTVRRAARGKVQTWNKLLRTGNVALEAHIRLKPELALETVAPVTRPVRHAGALPSGAPHGASSGREGAPHAGVAGRLGAPAPVPLLPDRSAVRDLPHQHVRGLRPAALQGDQDQGALPNGDAVPQDDLPRDHRLRAARDPRPELDARVAGGQESLG